MAHRLGMGTELEIDIPGQRVGLVPTREWRMSKGHPWEPGDTVVSGIGQGYITVSPLQLATYAARIASGRAIQPHFTRRIAGVLQPGIRPRRTGLIPSPFNTMPSRRGPGAVRGRERAPVA